MRKKYNVLPIYGAASGLIILYVDQNKLHYIMFMALYPFVLINFMFISFFFSGKPNEWMFFSYIGHSHKVQIIGVSTYPYPQLFLVDVYTIVRLRDLKKIHASVWFLGVLNSTLFHKRFLYYR